MTEFKTKINNKQLLNRLIRARNVCDICGYQFGTYSVGTSTYHKGKCDVCKIVTGVTETRDFGYLRVGIDLLKTKKVKKEKIKITVKPKKAKPINISRLWTKASKAMQDYHRANKHQCFGKSKSCTGFAQVMHHHIHWGTSKALRFKEENLIPLCQNCHCSVHSGHQSTSFNYRKSMQETYGIDWEDKLMEQNQQIIKTSKKDEIEMLKYMISFYGDM